MSEQSMWNRVRTALRGLDPVRIENTCELGTPDVNYVEGFVELKQVKRYPKRGGVIRVKHYTEDQKTWAIRRHHAGGRVFLFLKISNEWLLFKGHIAAEKLNKSTIEELREAACGRWLIKLNDPELRKLLTE